MLLSKETTVIWNAKNKKHYTSLGYKFTKMKEPFTVKVEDLTVGSSAEVELICDYCGKIFKQQWQTYRVLKNKTLQSDCCQECLQTKAKEAIGKKYGGYKEMHDAYDDKRSETNIRKYGSANVFGNKDIQTKIQNTNIKKYGAKCCMQSKDIQEKARITCLQKYGVNHYVELFRGKHIKENSPNWKGGCQTGRDGYESYEYAQWRKAVFDRDLYTCQMCGARNGNGRRVKLCAHHILNWRDNEDKRYDVSNGIVLCEQCHNKFHSIYGKRFNTKEQIDQFLSLDEKVC